VLAGRRDAAVDHVVISAKGLAADFDPLLRACQAFHGGHEQRTALQQTNSEAQSFAVQAS
jgi:hypothetical protein